MNVLNFVSRQELDVQEQQKQVVSQLLNEIRDGNEEVMRQFFITYSDDVYRYLISRCSDELIANDILNEVMMTVWNGSNKFEGRSKITTWLIGIARYKLIDHYRKEKRHSHEEINDEMSGDYSDNGESLEQKQDATILRTCVDKLVEIQREIVHLTFYSDMNYHDISKVIGCPVGTVKSRMYHARESMKQCIKSLSGGESYCGI